MAGKFERAAFLFKSTNVYDALFLKERVPTFFVGCSATILKLIEKKGIPQDQYYFASYTTKSGYKECSAEYKSRRLLIKADWVEKHVPGFGAASPAPVKTTAAIKPVVVKAYQPAPAFLHLEDSEKFIDAAGQLVDIEVRGERHWKKIWFKARDVEKMLELSDISGIVMQSTTSYEYGRDYQTFSLIGCPENLRASDQKKSGNQTAMFLSYSGLVRMLITRRHPIAERFQDWAFEKLFTLQHGTQDAKEELAADVLGVTPKALRAVLNTNANTVPAVYLFRLGLAKDLRSTLNIPESFADDHVVCKFGLSTDLSKRSSKLESEYRLPGVSLRIQYHVYIDPIYLSTAEKDVKDYFANAEWALEHSKYKELAVLSPQMLKSVVYDKYKALGVAYAGKLLELQTQLEALKEQIKRTEETHAQLIAEKDDRLRETKEHFAEMVSEKEKRLHERELSQAKMEDLYKALLKAQERELTLLRATST